MKQQWGQKAIPTASLDLNSAHAADHQVFAQIPPAGDSASSSLLPSVRHSSPPHHRWEETALGAAEWALAGKRYRFHQEELKHVTYLVLGEGR